MASAFAPPAVDAGAFGGAGAAAEHQSDNKDSDAGQSGAVSLEPVDEGQRDLNNTVDDRSGNRETQSHHERHQDPVGVLDRAAQQASFRLILDCPVSVVLLRWSECGCFMADSS